MNIIIKSNFQFSVTSIHYAPNGELCIELSSEKGNEKNRYQYTANLGNGQSEELPSLNLLEYTRNYVANSTIKEKSKDPYNQMIYPDGEVVSYKYIWGGDLFAMDGDKNGTLQSYIKGIHYNKFGQRDSVQYGNGTRAHYTYDALHRLYRLTSFQLGGAVMQNIKYTFDSVSNITNIKDSVLAIGTLGGGYDNTFNYDGLHRLGGSQGDSTLGHYRYTMDYTTSGRITSKRLETPSSSLTGSVNMFYGYCNDQKPHTVRRIFDEKNEKHFDLRWDDAGNLGQISIGNEDAKFETGRFLFWTEDNRMHAAVDEKYSSYYVYDHSGERRVKLTGTNDLLDVNADYMYTASVLKEPTIYPSAYMVMSNKGYTKHYYAGTERVAARIGGGGLKVIDQEHGLSDKSGSVFQQSLEQINDRILEKNDIECIANGLSSNDKLKIDMNEVPERLQAKLITDYDKFRQMIADAQSIHHNEPDVYFYHSDHLGSASWITDNGGLAVQHLQYLPYGERYVDQRAAGYNERFTFTGKERDEETGYGYFGARYMDHELMTMWLSVDPMADKYPSTSPYAYCAWNPVKLVDPDGQEYGDYFSSTGVWLGSDGINDGKLYRQVDFTDINSCLRNDYVEVGAPYSYAGTYEYVGNVTNITMDYTGTMAPDKNNNPHIAKGVFTITFHVGDQEFVRGKYEAWSGCNYKDGSVRYPLQNGEWMLANSDRPVSTSQKNSYTRDNACFKIDLSPVGFTTARYGIQIHPDGGANGTAGCIGIRTNPSDFYNAYKSCVSLHPNLKVNVNIKNNPNNNVPR